MKGIKQNEATPKVTELAELLTNLAEALADQSDGQFEEYKHRFRNEGLKGLEGLRFPKKTRPRVTSDRTVELIKALSVEHPGWGCIRISRALKGRGIAISPPTVQSILNKHNLRDKTERAMQLEERAVRESLVLSAEQMAMVEKVNPCFRERFHESLRPGELLVQDICFVGSFQEIGKTYLQMVIDTYNNYAFCLLQVGKFSDYAVALLHHEVLPFYQKQDLTVTRILTDNGREYCGKGQHHFELYLMLNEIEHSRLPLRQVQSNGYIERFRQTILHEFFLPIARKKQFDDLTPFQAALAAWLADYNENRSLRGYPNLGKTPLQMFQLFRQGA
jgi:transposase InsO family protein